MQGNMKVRWFWFGLIVAILLAAWGVDNFTEGNPVTAAENSPIATEEPEPTPLRQSVETARRICAIMDASDAITEPCGYSIWGAAITIRTAATPDVASDFCQTIKETVHANGWFLEAGWRMDIKHPFSGDANIATCRLR